MELIKNFKREFFYVILLFVMWEMGQIPEVLGIGWLYFVFAFLGGILVVTWVLTTFFQFSYKKVSEYSKVLIKINLKERGLLYFILPVAFYSFLSWYLYVYHNVLIKQFVIISGCLVLFLLFVHIRSSYEKLFSVAKITRIVLNFIDIILFYLSVSVLGILGLSFSAKVIAVTLIGAIFLIHQLLLHKQNSLYSLLVLSVSVFLIFLTAYVFRGAVPFIFSFTLTLLFYVIVSIWQTRLDGHTKVSDFMPPVLLGLMGLIIVMSF